MNHPFASSRHWLRAGERCLVYVSIAAVILSAMGCSIAKKEEEGDDEPKLADYHVTILPSDYTFRVKRSDRGKTLVADFKLKVECMGLPEFLPPGCNELFAVWSGKGNLPDYATTVLIKGHLAPETTAHIFLDVSRYLLEFDTSGGSLAPNGQFQQSFFPTKIPKGLGLTGRRYVEITIEVEPEQPEPVREAPPPEKPNLSVYPNQVWLTPGPGQPNPETRVQVTYKGPLTNLEAPVITGPGASRWGVSVAGGFPYPLNGDGNGPSVTITFLGPSTPSTGRATLVLRTRNDQAERITLIGP